MLLLKGSLLRSVKRKDTESSNTVIGMSMDMVYNDNTSKRDDEDIDGHLHLGSKSHVEALIVYVSWK